ncbi:hypothetical protein F2P45_33830, partial [Massilia sp. CCM 8733]
VLRVVQPAPQRHSVAATEAEAANDAAQFQPIRFLGQYHDSETGLNYNRFRYYDADCGRYVSLDPIGLAGGTNSYQYAPNPSGWVDPFGLTKTCNCKSGDKDAAGSPYIDPKDVAGKTPAQIEAVALAMGLQTKGPAPKAGRGAFVDPITGEQRVLVHPGGPHPHSHVNNPQGQRLDINGNVVAPESPAAHLPLGN